MGQLLERMRTAWEALNDREKGLVAMLAVVAAVFVLGFPLFWTAHQNAEITEENSQIRSVLTLIDKRRAQLLALAEARNASATRYQNRTPPLGSFLEEEAKKHDLHIAEVTDQPEKTAGNYHRRSVRASINDVGLTGVVDLLSGIETSQYPVAIDQIQVEHYQAGDSFRFKVGVLTFDPKEVKPSAASDSTKDQAKPGTGG
jgi:hypothetical protein